MYAYAGYPLALWIIGLCRARSGRRELQSEGSWPTVTFVIAAHNEDHVLDKRLENALALDYPKEKLEIVVASDTGEVYALEHTGRLRWRFSTAGPRNRGLSLTTPALIRPSTIDLPRVPALKFTKPSCMMVVPSPK